MYKTNTFHRDYLTLEVVSHRKAIYIRVFETAVNVSYLATT